jgi:hypothetical protein
MPLYNPWITATTRLYYKATTGAKATDETVWVQTRGSASFRRTSKTLGKGDLSAQCAQKKGDQLCVLQAFHEPRILCRDNSTGSPTANSEVVYYRVIVHTFGEIVISGAVVFAGTGLNRARLRISITHEIPKSVRFSI